MKLCGQCGADISHRAPQARFCEDAECQRARGRVAGRESWQRVGESQRAKRRAQYAARPRPVRAPRACKHCGVDISHRPPKARWCGRRCWFKTKHRENPEIAREKMAAARLRDPERLRATATAWRERNRTRYLEQTRRAQQKRRAWKNGASGDLLPRSWHRLLVQYEFACAYCHKRVARLVQEHVIPLSRGGRHGEGNIVPACQPCNNSKSDRLLVEWRAGRRIARKGRPAVLIHAD